VRACIFIVTVLLLSGCATKHATLERFIDKDIQEVIAVYGKPQNVFEMEGNHRDFQWVLISSRLPDYVISVGALVDPSERFEPDIEKRSITPMFNDKVILTECLYTMKTVYERESKRWLITGYQQPTSGC
jgi:hypothetical protein